MKHPYIIFACVVAAVAACSQRPEAGDFLQPVVSECVVALDGYRATFSCSVQGDGLVTSSGFVLSMGGGSGTRTAAALEQGYMSLDVKGLMPGAEYSLRAYVSNGRNELLGPETVFTVEETDPVVAVPDKVFKEYLLANFDVNEDGQLSEFEAEQIYNIDVRADNIRSLEGIAHFKNLENLNVSGTDVGEDKRVGQLRSVDLSGNNRLRFIDVSRNNIETLVLPEGGQRLEEIKCHINRIEELDVSKYPRLKVYECWQNRMSEVDVTKNLELESLGCATNDLFESGLDVSHNAKLKRLWCDDDGLQQLDVSRNPMLEELYCPINDIRSLDLSRNPKLRLLNVSGTLIESIDISMLPLLEDFCVDECRIYYPVDVSCNTKLRLYFGNNIHLSCAPDLSHNPALISIHISSTGGAEFIEKDFFCNWPDLESVNFCGYKGEELDLSQNRKLQDIWACDLQHLKVLDLSASPALRYLNIGGSAVLEKVYVHESVDIGRLTVEKTDDVTAVIEHKK